MFKIALCEDEKSMIIKSNEKIEVELDYFGKYGQTVVKEVYYHKFDTEHKRPLVKFGKKWCAVCSDKTLIGWR